MVTFVLFDELNPHFMLLKCVMLCAELLHCLPNQDINCGPLNMSPGSFNKATEAERCCITSSHSGITGGDRLHPGKDAGDTMDKLPAHG